MVGDEDINFKMIGTNVSSVVGQLDDVRRHPKYVKSSPHTPLLSYISVAGGWSLACPAPSPEGRMALDLSTCIILCIELFTSVNPYHCLAFVVEPGENMAVCTEDLA